MPRTAEDLGAEITDMIDERLNPKFAIDKGIEYFAGILKSFNGSYHLALEGYNMGPTGAKKKHKRYGKSWENHKWRIPKETRNYVVKALSRMMILANAKEYGMEFEKLPLFSDKLEKAGQHKTKAGDTIYKLARLYQTSP